MPGIFYHVSSRKNLKSIMDIGLVPTIGERSSEALESTPAIFCFTSQSHCEDALMNWLGDAYDDDEELVILALSPEQSPVLTDALFEVCFIESIPSSRILAVYDESWSLLNHL